MKPILAALALSAAVLVPLQADAQRAQAQAQTQSNGARPSPMAAYLSGHTTTFQISHNQHGRINLSLALLPDGTGWFFSEAANGGTWQPRLRYIYRWWIAQDGRLCYIYSSGPQNLNVQSFWTCWANRIEADGTPVFVNPRGEILPTVARVPGNALEPRTRVFLDIATRTFGPRLPTPPDPGSPPPP